MGIEIRKTGIRARKGSSPTIEDTYAVRGSNDADAIANALDDGTGATFPSGWAGVPLTQNGLVYDNLDINSTKDTFNWKAVASYNVDGSNPTPAKAPPAPIVNQEDITLDLTSLTTKTVQSKDTVQAVRAGGGTAPPFHGGIGWDGKQFQGVDVFYEAFSFSITKHWPASFILNSTSWIVLLRTAAFTVNDAVFRGFAPKSVLFAGASGSQTTDELFSITYQFLVSSKLTNVSVGDITGITKDAWDYLWVLYEATPDDDAKKLTQKPLAAYVERLYEESNFPNYLGITQ